MKKAQFFYLLRRGFFAGGGGEWSTLVNAFKTRVLADGGTLESESCIRDDVKYLIQNPEPVAFTGLLNDYSGAAAAYSLRLLDNTYTGNAIKVRRASDNAEQDIAFANNELDTATLETFASGTDAFVTTWYDQSGNNYNVTQTTASNQPKIVSSGSTILQDGKPIVDTSNSTRYMELDGFAFSSLSIFITATYDNGATEGSLISGGDDVQNRWDYGPRRTNDYRFLLQVVSDERINSTNNYKDGVRRLFTADYSHIGVNGSNVATGSLSTSIPVYTSGWRLSGRFFGTGFVEASNKFQEVILYDSDQSSNRTGIETNINDFYSIY